jgi:hypothetical protein
MLYEVKLELTHSREFPNGNTACGYELMLPLTSDHRLDYRAWQQHRHGNSVCRFWPKEEWRGELKHDRHGWFFAFGHGEARDEAILRRDDHRFIAGECIPITEFDGQTRIFRVVEVDPKPRRGDPVIPGTNHSSSSVTSQAPSMVSGAESAVPSGEGFEGTCSSNRQARR